MSPSSAALVPALAERVLQRLGFTHAPPPTFEGLARLYAAWCQRVPFDNVRKLIHLRSGEPSPLPGSDAGDFFASWLQDGTGATCWGGHTALHALLVTLGFRAARGYGTMMVAPDIPPNHGTVVVDLEGRRYLVDASILHGEPLELSFTSTTQVVHGAWGVTASAQTGPLLIRWRPIHMPQGLDCRIDRLDVDAQVFLDLHEGTRAWSPFNYQLYARVNRGDRVIGTGFGERFTFFADGAVERQVLEPQDRQRFLIEEIGIREELAMRVPADIATPPPPGSSTVRAQ